MLRHINDPVSALANMAMVTRERLIIAFTPIIESEEIILRAATPMTDPASDFTWWTGSRGTYRKVLENMGFQIERIVPSVAFFEPKGELETRRTLVARRCKPKSATPGACKIRRKRSSMDRATLPGDSAGSHFRFLADRPCPGRGQRRKLARVLPSRGEASLREYRDVSRRSESGQPQVRGLP